MHSHLLNKNDIDSNLYPALLQVFTIILLGYLAGTLKIVNKQQGSGLNVLVGTFILPALLLKNIATLDFSIVDWYFLSSIFVSKSIVFLIAMVLTLIVYRPFNIGMAATFAIFVSQSNDFALGVPIINAIYSSTHPDYINYIYLIAPISLCILNPIAFFFLELNEHWSKLKTLELEKHSNINSEENTLQDEGPSTSNSANNQVAETSLIRLSSYDFEDAVKPKKKSAVSEKISKKKLIKNTLFSTIKNPIVFMTFIGLIVNFIFKQQLPSLIEPIITTLADSFSALALFYLGLSMVGKIKNLSFIMIITMVILIFSKGLLFPLITREMITAFESFKDRQNSSEENDLSTFGFLYGTFPSAPSLLVFIGRYNAVQHDLVSASIIFGTFASAPLMMVSGKMISIEYFSNHSSTNFDDINCKTAYAFSFTTWFCCAWVLYIFLASGRILRSPHRYTFYLILAQMLNSFVHILWVSLTDGEDTVNTISNYTYVFFSLFSIFLTRCIPLTISLRLISVSKLQKYNKSRIHQVIFKLADSETFSTFIGFFLPLICAILCIISGHIPEKQGMMMTVGKPQIIISILLLIYLIFSISYALILFARTKFDQATGLSIVSSVQPQYEAIPILSDASGDTSDVDNQTNLLKSDRSSTLERELNNLYRMNIQFQMLQHISLIIVMLLAMWMCLFVQIWSLKDEKHTAIFFELQLLDTALLYGQGFFVFLTFGIDNQLIFSPIVFKLKTWFKLIKPFKLLPQDEVPEETKEVCEKFENLYKERCAKTIERDLRFHYTWHHKVFTGSDLIDWFIERKLVKTRKQGKILGRKFIQGRLINHVSYNRDFYDGYNLYKFHY